MIHKNYMGLIDNFGIKQIEINFLLTRMHLKYKIKMAIQTLNYAKLISADMRS